MHVKGGHLLLLLLCWDSQNVPSAAPIGNNQRHSKLQHGGSVKRGCHFMVRTTFNNDDGITELRMYCFEHHNTAGAAYGLQYSQWGTHYTEP